MALKRQTQESQDKRVRRSTPEQTPSSKSKTATTDTASSDAVQRAEVPAGLRPTDVAALQRSGGNLAVQRMLSAQLQRTDEKNDKMASQPILAGKKYDDFDGKQYRVSGRAPNRKIEEVKRTEETDSGGGKHVVYYAMGEVVSFKNKMPLVAYYPEPVSLGDWYPSVTHLNGMNVPVESGIQDAMSLQETVNSALDKGNAEKGVALQQSAVDVLYTYSAKRSNFFLDLIDCIKGKMGVEDTVTKSQETVMLDAVHQKHRVSVSAHSRGTIKTDNAVRTVYKVLIKEYLRDAKKDPAVQAAYEEAMARATEIGEEEASLSPDMLAEIASEEKAKQIAGKRAEADMNAYIQLIYAGNAVSFPSTVLKSDLYVGKRDMVSFFFGTYTKAGANMKSKGKATMHKVSGGHGFKQNYVDHVGGRIAEDVRMR